MTPIVATDLSFHYADQPPLFTELSFTIGPGTTAMTGPSGSGKSTLLGILAGWLRPTTGSVTHLPHKIQWVLQSPMGSPRRSAISHVQLPLLASGASRSDALEEATVLMQQMGLAKVAHRALRHLSGGEAQRLMLARAIAAKPELMLVDEPTAQLDASSAASVVDVIQSLAVSGLPIVIATHDAILADACSGRIDVRK